MASITLRQALGVLAKSSPFAVCTPAEASRRDSFDDLKEYLFIEQQIERDFQNLLESASDGEVIFLCGSSGDGKSEILTRHARRFGAKCRFHLDATHSFAPSQSGIQALDELFDKQTDDKRPLVIGINVGMLANYAKEGAKRHAEICAAIELFLDNRHGTTSYHFLDFEKYPKFYFNNHGEACSDFAKELMRRLTLNSPSNPFYALALRDAERGGEKRLLANFHLLALPTVQDTIIINLLKIRLARDQFITTRALLDFLHHLLTGDGYISDNLFRGIDNELVTRTSNFDPATKRTQKLDQFILRYELQLPDPALEDFLLELEKNSIYFPKNEIKLGQAGSLVRLFYLLRNENLGNGYHQQFAAEFVDPLLEKYAKTWYLHQNYNDEVKQKTQLRQFYVNELINAIYLYANRNALNLEKGELFIGEFGSVQLAVPVELKVDYARIKNQNNGAASLFYAYLRVSENTLQPIPVNYNLFELVRKLNAGYRPNRYDKSAIVMLDEIVEQISEIAKLSQKLRFYDNGHEYSAILDDEIISISGV
jgi:DNA phosphorothioation-dependent restriction protein DptF